MAYTEDEIALLATTPQLIGTAVAAVGSSGLIGTGKELFATATSVMKGVQTFPSNALLKQSPSIRMINSTGLVRDRP
jgi:hypothetical protein